VLLGSSGMSEGADKKVGWNFNGGIAMTLAYPNPLLKHLSPS
jgi:hypothetical protein